MMKILWDFGPEFHHTGLQFYTRRESSEEGPLTKQCLGMRYDECESKFRESACPRSIITRLKGRSEDTRIRNPRSVAIGIVIRITEYAPWHTFHLKL
jgi:hypothetical protein